jgi:cytochrome c553
MQRLPTLLIMLFLLAACSPSDPLTFKDLPPGDAARGATKFTQEINGAPACNSCHTLDHNVLTGPGMQGFSARAGSRENGKSAAEYAFESITQPANYIVGGFSNAMYNNYGAKLSPQDIADVIAYLLTL